jgi:hypothetical protein
MKLVTTVGARRVATLLTAFAAAAGVVPAALAGSRDSGPAGVPTLYVQYAMNCTFTIVDDAGKPVSSIPGGTYQVEVSTPTLFKLVVPGGREGGGIAPSDFTGCKGWVQFQLTGPGVNLSTTLDYGCDAYYLLPATSFKPGSTYTVQDMNQPTVAHATFTTLTSGSPTLPPSPYGPTSGKGTPSQDLIGSRIGTALQGTLTGALSAKGKPTLTSKGKDVSILKAGRYKFAISDRSPKAGFILRAVSGPSKDLTEAKFVGTHSVTVTLKAGRWMYYSNLGKPNYFLVRG